MEIGNGYGAMVMSGLRPLYRGRAIGTFNLLFSALLDGVTPGQR